MLDKKILHLLERSIALVARSRMVGASRYRFLCEPCQTLKNAPDTPLKVECAKVDAFNLALADKARNHRDRKVNSVLLDEIVVRLQVEG